MTDQLMNRTLSAKAVTYIGRGSYDVIHVREHAVRAPAAGEVRIQVKAAGVNPTDLLLREAGVADQTAPIIPGMDAAGIIESVGPGVSRLRPGDRVMTAVMPRRPEGGAQAEYIVAPAASVVVIPDKTSFAEAATLPMNGLTAFLALDLAGLAPGQCLAVTGGAGLLAYYAIAEAKRRGLRTIADAKDDDTERVRQYGADIVVPRGTAFAVEVRRAVPEGVDALLDTAVLGEASFAAIRDGGVYIPVRGWADKDPVPHLTIKPAFVYTVFERTDWLESLRDRIADGALALRVAGEYAPEQAADAQRALAAGGLRGRRVIMF